MGSLAKRWKENKEKEREKETEREGKEKDTRSASAEGLVYHNIHSLIHAITIRK
ncbi:MAG: hypothetical protein WAM14_18455 [Candidatus Nitrosopolaris sp.]